MKNAFKTVSLILAISLTFLLCGCGNDKKTGFVAEDEYYTIEDEDTGDNAAGNGTDAGNEGTDNNRQGDSGNTNSGGGDGGDFDYDPIVTDATNGFIPKEIPNRKNAYKLSNTFNKLQSGETLNVFYYGGTEKTIAGVSKQELIEYPVFENLANTAHTVTVTAIGDPPYITIAALITTNP